MQLDAQVKIQADKSSQTKYLIKDINDIIIGRFSTMELESSSKTCDIKLKFYREYNGELLNDTLTLILKATFKNSNIFKVNIKLLANIDVSPFLDLGFTLEGIFNQNQYFKGEYFDELSFGITRIQYNHMNRDSLVELKGENIILKNLTPANANDLLEYYINNKKHLEPFEPVRDNDFYTLEIQRNILNESYRQFLNGTNIDLGIFRDNKLIGKIKLSSIIYGVFKNAILGYSIDSHYQGNGYMKEAVNLILDYAFNECDLHRVEASVLLDNIRSIKVLENCGFNLLGINKKYLFINGQWKDHYTYYILKEEYYKNYERLGN